MYSVLSKQIFLISLLAFHLSVYQHLFAQSDVDSVFYTNSEGSLYISKDEPIFMKIFRGGSEKELTNDDHKKEFNLNKEGLYKVQVLDPQGKKMGSIPIRVDGTPPKTTLSFSYQNRATIQGFHYYNQQVALSLKATDKLSQVYGIYYKINEGTVNLYRDKIIMNDEGKYTLYYYAVDNVRNRETTKKSVFFIDKTAPLTSLNIKGDRFNNIVSPKATMEVKGEDEHIGSSGVEKSFIRFNEQPLKNAKNIAFPLNKLLDGEHIVSFYSVDKVQNEEKEKQYSFYLDKTPPYCNSKIIGTQYQSSQLYVSKTAKVSLKATDNKAGVESIFYSFNNQKYYLYDSPFSVADTSRNTSDKTNIYFYAVDKVKNTSQVTLSSLNFMIDDEPPTISYQLQGGVFEARDTTFLGLGSSIKVDTKDNLSGVQSVQYQIDDNPLQPYNEPIKLTKSGWQKVTLHAQDQINNASSKELFVFLDDIAPSLNYTFSATPLKPESDTVDYILLPPYVKLYLSSRDIHTDIENIFYNINNEPKENLYKTPLENLPIGKLLLINFKVVDKLNNYNESEIKIILQK